MPPPPVILPTNGLTPDEQITQQLGNTTPAKGDPAWAPPRDRLRDPAEVRAKAGVISREVPMTTIGTGWSVPTVRQALEDLVGGLFDQPSQLVDSVIGDSRVQAGLASRVGGLLGRPVDFVVPRKYRDSELARECKQAFEDAWPTMATEPMLGTLQRWAVMLGFSPAQILWDTEGEYAVPHPLPWHPRYTYYHWTLRCYVAITLDGQQPILPGDGHWILHAPYGDYRGWMMGAVRAIAPWWLCRNYALRDWARWSERHGLPIIKAITPAAGDKGEILQFRNDLSNLGSETMVQLPKGNDGVNSYDLDLLEAKDAAHEGFSQLIGACDKEITLALLAQNLTTEVKEGSYAAARVHADVRQALLEADARALASTIYAQLARPFAAMNFGNADLAPRVLWDIRPYEDAETSARTLLTVTQSLVNLKNAGLEHVDPAAVERLAKSFGLDVGRLRIAQAAAEPRPGAPASAHARFVAMADQYMRVRIDAGVSERELEAETEALAELLADPMMHRAFRRRR